MEHTSVWRHASSNYHLNQMEGSRPDLSFFIASHLHPRVGWRLKPSWIINVASSLRLFLLIILIPDIESIQNHCSKSRQFCVFSCRLCRLCRIKRKKFVLARKLRFVLWHVRHSNYLFSHTYLNAAPTLALFYERKYWLILILRRFFSYWIRFRCANSIHRFIRYVGISIQSRNTQIISLL